MMTNISLKNKAAQNLPAFIRDDYKLFTIFLDSYHQWLESYQADIELLSSLDTTIESFIVNFKKEVNYQNIKFPNIDEKFLLRHIKNLYISKGTEESFSILFKLLFNSDIIIKYPDQMTVKASDGKWEQLVSIFVEVESGEATSIANNIVRVTNTNLNRTIDLTIEDVKPRRVGGGISSISIGSGGSGYTTPSISSMGGAGGGVMMRAIVDSGVITSILLTNGGVGYSSSDFTILGGGTGADIDAVFSNGVISAITLEAGGSGYTTGATVFTGGGQGAQATATVVNGEISTISLISGGSGYINPSLLFIGGGHGAIATVTVNDGVITAVSIITGGSGYINPIISFGGGGWGATASLGTSDGVITSIIIDNPGNNYSTAPIITISGTNTTPAIINSVQMFMMPDIYECNINQQHFSTLAIDDIITFNGFIGKILPTINSFEIVDPGKNFRLGQTFDIETVFGKGATVKVSKLDSNKGIAELKFIRYGFGYITDFESFNIIPPNISLSRPLEGFSPTIFNRVGYFGSSTLYHINDVVFDSTNDTYYKCILSYTSEVIPSAPSVDTSHWSLYLGTEETRIGTFHEYVLPDPSGGYILKETYTGAMTVMNRLYPQFVPPQTPQNSFDVYAADYVGELLREFYSSNKYNGDITNGARIRFKLGAVCKYPGHYINSDGMVSDDVRIQDSLLYQKYSYIIQADQRLNEYRDVVKSVLHPAGLALFGEYDIQNNLNVKLKMSSIFPRFFIRHADAITSINKEDTDNWFLKNNIVNDDSCLLYNIQQDWTNITDVDSPLYAQNWIRFTSKIVNDTSYDIINDGSTKDFATAINVDHIGGGLSGPSDNVFFKTQIISDESYDIIGGIKDTTSIPDPDYFVSIANHSAQFIVKSTAKEVNDTSYSLIGGTTDWTNILDPDYFVSVTNMNATDWVRFTSKIVNDTSYALIGGTTDWTNILDPDYFVSLIDMNATDWVRFTIKEVSDASYGIIGGTTDWTNILDPDYFVSLIDMNATDWVRFTSKIVNDNSYGIIGGTTDWTNILDPDYFVSLIDMNATDWVRFTAKEVNDNSYGIIGGTTDWTNILDPDYFVSLIDMNATDWVRFTNKEVSDNSYGIIGGTTDWTNILDYENAMWINAVSTVIQDPLDYVTSISSDIQGNSDSIFTFNGIYTENADAVTENFKYELGFCLGSLNAIQTIGTAQTGTRTSLTLMNGSNEINDAYAYQRLTITSGAGIGQVRTTLSSRKNLITNSSSISEVSWIKGTGFAFTPNSAVGINGSMTADTLNLGSSTIEYDYYKGPIAVIPGTTYTVSRYVKFGTATNICMVVNDTLAWNTVGGRSYTAADGLNTSTFTRISYTFVAPSTGAVNIHFGKQIEGGLTAQSVGTAICDGYQLELGSSASEYIRTGALPAVGVSVAPSWSSNMMRSSFTIGNVVWIKASGFTFTSGGATGIDGTMSADLLNLGSGIAGADFYYPQLSVVSGVIYTISCSVKLVTATNLCLVVNDTLAWNTVGHREFTAADGLNTSTFTRISYTFTAPVNGVVNIHFGRHSETMNPQTIGSVIIDGYQVEIGSSMSPYIITTSSSALLPDATSTYLLEDRDMYDQTTLWNSNSDSIMLECIFGLLLWTDIFTNQNLTTDSCSVQDFDINSSVIFTKEIVMSPIIETMTTTTDSGAVVLNSYVDLLAALYVDPQYVSAPDQLFTT